MSDPRVGWNRLEATLITIKPGETVTVDALVTETGLLPETVETVLNTLTKAELFERKEEHVFVRRRLFQAVAPEAVPATAAPIDQGRRYGDNSMRAGRTAPSCS